MAKDQRSLRTDANGRGRLSRHLVLVGLMGAGKSAIGRRVATAIDARFLDADREIEAAAGMKIPDIFETRGEEEFREGERKVIARLLDEPPLVLATGGGAFIDPETRSLLKEKTTTVWMRADLDVLVKRCGRRSNRPLLKNGNPKEILAQLMDARYPVYAEADIEILSQDEPHEVAVDAIIDVLTQRGDLKATRT